MVRGYSRAVKGLRLSDWILGFCKVCRVWRFRAWRCRILASVSGVGVLPVEYPENGLCFRHTTVPAPHGQPQCRPLISRTGTGSRNQEKRGRATQNRKSHERGLLSRRTQPREQLVLVSVGSYSMIRMESTQKNTK